MKMREMQGRGKKAAVVVMFIAAIAAGAAYACGAPSEAGKPAIVVQSEQADGEGAAQERSEKQRRFEKHLARKEAEFRRRYDEVKSRNDEIRRKFEQCREVSEEELWELLAKERGKQLRK